MLRLVGSLFAAFALAACSEPPQTASRADGVAPGCHVAQNGKVVCAQAASPGAAPPAAAPPPPGAQQRVAYAQMVQGGSGTYYVDVAISRVCCFKMLLDTGASDVSVPIMLWYAMMKDGVITEADHIDVAKYRTANGVVEGLRFRMPPMTVAGITVHNVVGSVSKNNTGKLILLGQSFLQKFKAWQINNATGQLILAY